MSFSMILMMVLAVGIVLMLGLIVLSKVPVGYNLRNLIVRWPVTLLTALAFTLVVGLLTIMLAFVNGMYRLTEGSGQPGNVLVLSDGATDEVFSNLAFQNTNDIEYSNEAKPFLLRDDKGQPLCSREVYIVVNQPVPVPAGEKPRRRFVQVRGIDNPVMSGMVHGLKLYPGGDWFSSAGVRPLPGGDGKEQAIEAVLGEGIARELGRDQGKPRLDVGDLFDVGGRKWLVTGITQSMGSTFGSEVWAKRDLAGKMFGKEYIVTSIVLKTPDADSATKLADALRTGYKKAAVLAQPETEYYAKQTATNAQFLVATIFVAVIMAIGGIFGVMNTMFAAISQRTRDIGVLRIMGFAPRQVLISFFVESLWIALIGGALGCLAGYLANGYTAASIVGSGQGGGKSVVFKLVIDANVVASGMLFTLIMGGIGGLLPAWSAMRLKPLDAIR